VTKYKIGFYFKLSVHVADDRNKAANYKIGFYLKLSVHVADERNNVTNYKIVFLLSVHVVCERLYLCKQENFHL